MDCCARQLFARHDLRCTRQREALYDTLRACRCHPTAEELYRMLAMRGGAAASSMSRATVYNTLDILCRAGLVRRLPMPGSICRFDADTSDHLHVRVNEHEVRDVPADLGERLVAGIPPEALKAIEQAMGVRIDSVNIQIVARQPAWIDD